MYKTIKVCLIFIVALAFFLRFYRLDSAPPSLNWDEAAAGYNAFTIANYGRDEFGNPWPIYFRSFGDDKHPVHIYLTALSQRILGTTPLATRLPSAVVGTLATILIFLLARLIFKSDLAGLIAGLIWAVSPFSIQFSRGDWETNFAVFFLILGLWLFFSAVLEKRLSNKKRDLYLVFSALSFGVDLFTYQSALIVTPIIVLMLIVLYYRELAKIGSKYTAGSTLLVLVLVLLLNKPLWGGARAGQSKITDNIVLQTSLYKQTHNYILGYTQATLNQYPEHFEYTFLFDRGDSNSRHSIGAVGELYKLDLPFLILGLIFLIKMRSRVTVILLAWLLLAPLPSALVAEAPSANHAGFLMGSLHLIVALGVVSLLGLIKSQPVKILGVVAYVLILGFFVKGYLNNYYNLYANDSAGAFQYGFKQAADFIKDNPKYTDIYITDVRSQPYIFFLYYLEYPQNNYLNSVFYNTNQNKDVSLVSSFGEERRFHFSDWDPLDCQPQPGVLCMVTNDQYGGLKYKQMFKVLKEIPFPGQTSPAFYLVGVN